MQLQYFVSFHNRCDFITSYQMRLHYFVSFHNRCDFITSYQMRLHYFVSFHNRCDFITSYQMRLHYFVSFHICDFITLFHFIIDISLLSFNSYQISIKYSILYSKLIIMLQSPVRVILLILLKCFSDDITLIVDN
jgi:hypothetical protein